MCVIDLADASGRADYEFEFMNDDWFNQTPLLRNKIKPFCISFGRLTAYECCITYFDMTTSSKMLERCIYI